MLPDVLVFLNIETLLPGPFETARSGLPSPSISPMATKYGPVPVGKSTLVANDPAVMEPEVLVFLNTETVLLPVFAVTMSILPSPSISPMATKYGAVPVTKSTLVANDPAVIEPEVLVFL